MKKHKLLLYEFASRRIRNKLLLLWLILLATAVFDWFVPLFGGYWFVVWLLIAALMLLWIYYAFLVRRAALIVLPKYMVLRGPLTEVKISYGRVASVTASHMSQHFESQTLKGRERFIVEPLYKYSCGFVELFSFPKTLNKKGRRHFSRFLFSPRRTGLLLVVDDWMQLSRDVEVARQKWREAHELMKKEDTRSLAARILDY
jgi:hypothetical protein